MEWGNTLLDDFVLGLTGRRASEGLLPADRQRRRRPLRRAVLPGVFGSERCEPSHISLFRRETGVGDPRAHLLAQDLIYVGGGSLVSLLGTWRRARSR